MMCWQCLTLARLLANYTCYPTQARQKHSLLASGTNQHRVLVSPTAAFIKATPSLTNQKPTCFTDIGEARQQTGPTGETNYYYYYLLLRMLSSVRVTGALNPYHVTMLTFSSSTRGFKSLSWAALLMLDRLLPPCWRQSASPLPLHFELEYVSEVKRKAEQRRTYLTRTSRLSSHWPDDSIQCRARPWGIHQTFAWGGRAGVKNILFCTIICVCLFPDQLGACLVISDLQFVFLGWITLDSRDESVSLSKWIL